MTKENLTRKSGAVGLGHEYDLQGLGWVQKPMPRGKATNQTNFGAASKCQTYRSVMRADIRAFQCMSCGSAILFCLLFKTKLKHDKPVFPV